MAIIAVPAPYVPAALEACRLKGMVGGPDPFGRF
jgi:hypothetical protein